MSDHFLHDADGRCHTVLTVADIYAYHGFLFEFHHFCGPCKLNKDYEPAKRQGRKFWKAVDAWLKLTKKQQEATRVSG